MTTIQVRTDEKLKQDAMKVLARLGLDLSTAVKMFLVQVNLHKGIPFPIVTDNGFTPAQEEEIVKALRSAKKSKKGFASAKELHRAILGG